MELLTVHRIGSTQWNQVKYLRSRIKTTMTFRAQPWSRAIPIQLISGPERATYGASAGRAGERRPKALHNGIRTSIVTTVTTMIMTVTFGSSKL